MKSKSLISILLGVSIIFEATCVGIYENDVVFADTSTDNVVTDSMKTDLFYGYDVTTGISLMESDAISKRFPIIDLDSDYCNHINFVDGSGKQESKSSNGTSIQALTSEFSNNFNFDTLGNIYNVALNLGAQFDMSNRVSSVYAEYYDMCSTVIDRCYSTVNLDKTDIRDYLDEDFKNALYSVNDSDSAKLFFAKYGTHLGTGYKYGGMMNITNYKTTSDYLCDLSEGLDLKTKFSYAKSGVEGSFSELYASGENTSTETSTYSFYSYGGRGVASLTVDDLFIYNSAIQGGEIEYSKWVKSINEGEKLTIIGISNKCEMIPLWDLIDPCNPKAYELRDILIETYIELCGDAYDDYSEMFSQVDRTASAGESLDTDSAFPILNGSYIKTKNNYFYYVDISDFSRDGDHYELHNGDNLYLDLSNSEYDYDFVFEGCELKNKRNAIFEVTGCAGEKVIIKCKYGDEERTLLNIDIKKCKFEGGSGTEKYPYLICNEEQFMEISDENYYYRLVNDINMKQDSINCIGNFNGCLDGDYCKVYNFMITDSESSGLFNENKGTIKNIRFEQCGTAMSHTDLKSIEIKLNDENIDKPDNAITSECVGVLCSKNTGIISNCYFTNVFLYNLNIDESYKEDKKIEMSTGIVCGINYGTIEYCMVENSDVICAYINQGKSNADSIFVYSGGIAGQVITGSVNNSVVKLDENNYIYSRTGNNNDLISNGSEIRTFAAGLAGYCDKNPTSKFCNDYVYLNDCEQINVFNQNYGKTKATQYNPSDYHHLKSILLIAEEDNIDFEKNYGFCANNEDELKLCIIPNTDKSGNNSNKKAYIVISNEELKQDRANCAVINGDNKTIYSKDNEICHLLSLPKSEYITVCCDDEQSNIKSTYCVGDILTVKGLELTRKINDEENQDLIVFRLRLFKNNMLVMCDDVLDEVGTDLYVATIYLYSDADKVYVNEDKKLSVLKNDIDYFEISSLDNQVVYLDNIDEYLDSWDTSCVNIIAVKTNGEKVSIDSDKDIVASEFKIITTADSIVAGDNFIEVDYKGIKSKYILNVKERAVDHIEIASVPLKTEYDVGDNVELAGLKVNLVYEDGDIKNLDSFDDLEFIGMSVVEGDNTIWVAYNGYSTENRASFNVKGIKKNEEDITSETVDSINETTTTETTVETTVETTEVLVETSTTEIVINETNSTTSQSVSVVCIVLLILVSGVIGLYFYIQKKEDKKLLVEQKLKNLKMQLKRIVKK